MKGGIVVWKLEMKRSHFSGPETVTSDIFGYLGLGSVIDFLLHNS